MVRLVFALLIVMAVLDPSPAQVCGDLNNDSSVNVTDALILTQCLANGGVCPPVSPGPLCATDSLSDCRAIPDLRPSFGGPAPAAVDCTDGAIDPAFGDFFEALGYLGAIDPAASCSASACDWLSIPWISFAREWAGRGPRRQYWNSGRSPRSARLPIRPGHGSVWRLDERWTVLGRG